MKRPEIWKDIQGYEGLYMVSDHGRVKTMKFRNNRGEIERERILSPCVKDNRYLYVGLSKDGQRRNKYIHRLVAEAFVPNELNKRIVNHIDFDVTNNSASNLEWCTQKENVAHSSERMRRQKKSATPKSTGEKYIRLKGDRYQLYIARDGKKTVYKSFDTLEEAVQYREKIIKGGV